MATDEALIIAVNARLADGPATRAMLGQICDRAAGRIVRDDILDKAIRHSNAVSLGPVFVARGSEEAPSLMNIWDRDRLARLDQLRSDSALRERFGARALGGPSAILAAVVWLLHGDDPQGEHGAGPASGGLGTAIGGVVGGATRGQVHHHETQPAQTALVNSSAGALDGTHDDAGRLLVHRVAAVDVGDEE